MSLTGGKGEDYLDGGGGIDTAKRVGAGRSRAVLHHRVTRIRVVVTGDTHLGPRRRGPLPLRCSPRARVPIASSTQAT